MPAKNKKIIDTTQKMFFKICEGANWFTIFFLWISAASGLINPGGSAVIAFLNLMFPLLAIFNILFLIFWLLFKIRQSWIPIVGFVCCIGSVRAYYPLNIPKEHPVGSIKFMSYNVMNFCGENKKELLEYISFVNPDILCLQESSLSDKEWNENVVPILSKTMKYYARKGTESKKPSGVTCFSRFPIISCDSIKYESESNGSIAIKIKMGKDTILIINNHFESNHLTAEDREKYKGIVKNPENKAVEEDTKSLVKKVGKAGIIRAKQAKTVATYIEQNKHRYPTIACGDFNDSPISYTHHLISEQLDDSYVATANGPGFSFNRDGIFVRIDNVFNSEHWKSYEFIVDRSCKLSDHYPIYGYFTLIKGK